MTVEGRRIAVIGAGIFGCALALELAGAGARVSVFERAPEVLAGASGNNLNRLHLGFHYPRSFETADQSDRSYDAFVAAFPGCIARDFPNAYFIAEEGSLTSAEEYLAFCKRLRHPFEPIAAADFPVTEIRGCRTGILCREGVYDAALFAREFHARQKAEEAITLRCGAEVADLATAAAGFRLTLADGTCGGTFDAVVNCAYADINRLTARLGHQVNDNQYEYTVVPIIELDLPPFGVAVMDGPFASIMPWGRRSQFLLYHVAHTVVATEVGPALDPGWRDAATAPVTPGGREASFEAIRGAAAAFLPALADARLAGFLEGPRMVLKDHDEDDARPSLVTDYGGGYLTVYAGKVVHSVTIAAEVRERLAHLFA